MLEDQGHAIHLPEPQVSPGDSFLARGEWWEVEQVCGSVTMVHPMRRRAQYRFSTDFVAKRMLEMKPNGRP